MMRPILLIVSLLLSFGTLMAQDLPYYRTENTRPKVEVEDEIRARPKFTVGIKSGVNVSFTNIVEANTGSSIADLENESKTGLATMAVFFLPLNDKGGISLEAGYLLKNNAYSFEGGIDTTVVNLNELHYFGTALSYRKHFGDGLDVGRGLRGYAAIGLGFNFLTKGRFRQTVAGSPFSGTADLTDDYNSLDVDLLLGFGTEIPIAPRSRLLLEARGGLGLTDFDDQAYSKATGSNLSNLLDFQANSISLNLGLVTDF